MIPSPSEYRLNEDQIDRSGSVCMARVLGDYLTCDPRWKPHVYYEAQCDRVPLGGKDLCKTCGSREQRKHKLWIGRITEDPLPHCHMLGTEWAKKCKWVGEVSPSPVVGEATPVVGDVTPVVQVGNVIPEVEHTTPEIQTPVEEPCAVPEPPTAEPALSQESKKPYMITNSIEKMLLYSFFAAGIGITLYHFLWCPFRHHL